MNYFSIEPSILIALQEIELLPNIPVLFTTKIMNKKCQAYVSSDAFLAAVLGLVVQMDFALGKFLVVFFGKSATAHFAPPVSTLTLDRFPCQSSWGLVSSADLE